jgi:uncharacterized protein (TIGR02145 family)
MSRIKLFHSKLCCKLILLIAVMKKINNYFLILCTFLYILFTTNCKQDNLVKMTILETGTISNITYNSASASATFVDIGDNISSYGHCWNTIGNPTTADSKFTVSGTAQKVEYNSTLTNLAGGTKYYVKAFAVDEGKQIYGSEISFTTSAVPSININAPLSGEHWVGGETHTIIWNDNIDENVNITLYKNGIVNQTIKSNAPSSGQYDWPLPNNIVYAPDYKIRITSVINSNIFAESQSFIVSEISGTTGILADNSLNTYTTIKIGKQWWMAQNLETWRFNDSEDIPYVVHGVAWRDYITPACGYYEDNTENRETYGNFYNWYAVSTGKLCPIGWHIPTHEEWNELEDFLGGYLIAGDKMKESGTAHWYPPNNKATNSSSFTALPAGFRDFADGQDMAITEYTGWWCSNSSSEFEAFSHGIDYRFSNVIIHDNDSKKYGFSVRCVKD